MPYTNKEARELGEHHGYSAANYAANVSGETVQEPERPLGMSDDEWMYYQDGWTSAVEEFNLADEMSDWSEEEQEA